MSLQLLYYPKFPNYLKILDYHDYQQKLLNNLNYFQKHFEHYIWLLINLLKNYPHA